MQKSAVVALWAESEVKISAHGGGLWVRQRVTGVRSEAPRREVFTEQRDSYVMLWSGEAETRLALLFIEVTLRQSF